MASNQWLLGFLFWPAVKRNFTGRMVTSVVRRIQIVMRFYGRRGSVVTQRQYMTAVSLPSFYPIVNVHTIYIPCNGPFKFGLPSPYSYAGCLELRPKRLFTISCNDTAQHISGNKWYQRKEKKCRSCAIGATVYVNARLHAWFQAHVRSCCVSWLSKCQVTCSKQTQKRPRVFLRCAGAGSD